MLFRQVYQSALKSNNNLEKGVMTGVQNVLTSAMLNNVSKYNVTSREYSKYYGLSSVEMGVLFEYFSIRGKVKKGIKDWYNGYISNIGTYDEPIFIDKYNIWSVANYLNNQSDGFKSYWENSSLGEVINAKILQNSTIRDTVEGLINNRNLLANFRSEFSASDFQTLKSIVHDHDQEESTSVGVRLVFSYLFITGYLTITSRTNEYCIPNKEIRIEFEKKLTEYYQQIFNISPSEFNELTMNIDSAISEVDVNNISCIFIEKFAPNLSILISKLKLFKKRAKSGRGLFANEDLMHSLFNYIAIQIVNAKFASERYTTKTNVIKGRADIVIEKNNKVIVIEMKSNAADVSIALEQAKGNMKLVKDDDTKIFIGCNITDQGKVLISGEIVSGNISIHFEYP